MNTFKAKSFDPDDDFDDDLDDFEYDLEDDEDKKKITSSELLTNLIQTLKCKSLDINKNSNCYVLTLSFKDNVKVIGVGNNFREAAQNILITYRASAVFNISQKNFEKLTRLFKEKE